MKNVITLLSVVALLAVGGICRADGSADLAGENAELKQRVGKLEKELDELKKIVMQQTKESQAAKTESKPAAAPAAEQKASVVPQLSDADMQKILAMVQKDADKKKPVWSDLDIQLYGILRLDAAYDSAHIEPGNYAKWVRPEKGNKNDNQFNMTANQTRLGMRINGPSDDKMKISGLVEFDFYNSGLTGNEENKATIKMRHAYLKLEWPEDRFEILAGQTWDVISPLNPSTLNDTVNWYAGNIGYRSPQLRLTKTFGLTSDVDLKLEGALTRNIGRKNTTFSSADQIDSGQDSGSPGIQGRTSLAFPFFGPKPTTIGFSGHWAPEEYDTSSTTGAHRDFESRSLNLDLTQPINKWLTIQGEAFSGQDLDAYLGGIGQGVNLTRLEEIEAKGGWIAANLGPWDKWRFTVGTGVDDPADDDLNAGDRSLNRSVFGNVIYSINKNAEIGLELSQWHTEYKGQDDADSLRAQTAFMYKF